MSLYKHLSYRMALTEIIDSRRHSPEKFTLRELAESSGLQPSFLTNVLKGRFDFNADQLYAVAVELGLAEIERRYLSLLLEFERSTHKPRREELRKEIEHSRNEQRKSERHLTAKPVELSHDAQAEYYLDPFVQIVHVLLNLAPYNETPEKLAGAIGVTSGHLTQIFDVLLRIGYIRRFGSTYEVIGRNKHLPRENPLCGPHQALLRLKSIDQMQRLSASEMYSFSATITGTDETREQLREVWLGFLKRAEAIVKPAPSQKAFQINFDLFPWEL